MAEAPKETVSEPTPALSLQSQLVDETAASLASKLTDWVDSRDWVPDALNEPVALGILLLGVALVAFLLYVVFRPLILHWVTKAVHKTEFTWDNDLVGHGVFRWLTHLLPGIFVFLIVPGLFESAPALAKGLRIASSLYLLVTGYFVFDSLLNSLNAMIEHSSVGKRFNVAPFVQVAKLLTALVVLILAVAIMVGQSPAVLIGGIGVFASINMLVFKDVILGFVAGIQLSSNQMLSVGDWLEMPSQHADGDVQEIGLTTVKVRNWDMTVTTIPTYALISESFKNWRLQQNDISTWSTPDVSTLLRPLFTTHRKSARVNGRITKVHVVEGFKPDVTEFLAWMRGEEETPDAGDPAVVEDGSVHDPVVDSTV